MVEDGILDFAVFRRNQVLPLFLIEVTNPIVDFTLDTIPAPLKQNKPVKRKCPPSFSQMSLPAPGLQWIPPLPQGPPAKRARGQGWVPNGPPNGWNPYGWGQANSLNWQPPPPGYNSFWPNNPQNW